MSHPLEQLRDDALREIESATDEQALETTRVKYLGRSGSISAWGEQMKTLSKEEKPIVGKLLNEVRQAVTAATDARVENFRAQKLAKGEKDPLDPRGENPNTKAIAAHQKYSAWLRQRTKEFRATLSTQVPGRSERTTQ